MKVVIQCGQCERKSIVEGGSLTGPDKKRLRCRRCGASYDVEAIKEALANTKKDHV